MAASTDCKTKSFFQAGFRQPEIDAVITVLGGISGLDLQSQQQQGSGLYAGVAPSKPKAFEKLLLAAADSGKGCCDPPAFNGPNALQYLSLLSCS